METQEWTGEDRRHPRWLFRREISAGNVLTLVALAAPLMVWAVNLDKRLTLIETIIITQQREDDRQEQVSSDLRREIRGELTILNAKVDRILESQSRITLGGR